MLFFKKTVYAQEYGCWCDNWDSVGKKMFFFSQLLLLEFILQKAETKASAKFLQPNGRRKRLPSERLCWISLGQRDLLSGHPPPRARRRSQGKIRSILLLEGSCAYGFLTCLTALLAHPGAGKKHQDSHQLHGHPIPTEPRSPELVRLPRVCPSL